MLKRYKGKFYSPYTCYMCFKSISSEEMVKFGGLCLNCYLTKKYQEVIMRNRIKRINIKYAYYTCEVCGRQIDSSEYYTWGRCYLCRQNYENFNIIEYNIYYLKYLFY